MSAHKKINFVQLVALALAAIAYTPKGDEEEFSEWADATLNSLPGTTLDLLYEEHYLDKNANPSPAAMKLLLNGCSFTPDFQRLASGDFSTAIKMIFEGQKALEKRVDAQEVKQIVPRKNPDGTWVDPRMCESLLSIRNWIDNVTSEYQASLAPAPTMKMVKNKK